MPEAPNILLVMTDQQRWDTLRCYGYEHMITPNVDALAARIGRATMQKLAAWGKRRGIGGTPFHLVGPLFKFPDPVQVVGNPCPRVGTQR